MKLWSNQSLSTIQLGKGGKSINSSIPIEIRGCFRVQTQMSFLPYDHDTIKGNGGAVRRGDVWRFGQARSLHDAPSADSSN